jgi:transcriptional regulator with XRE-family HTH domain
MYRRAKTGRNTAVLKSGLRLFFSDAMSLNMQLSDWLSQNGVRPSDLAARIGVSPQTITGWCQGSFWISKENARKIFKETKGEVTPTDLMQTKVKA